MNKERLLKLADHLENGKLGHKKFNFAFFNVDTEDGGVSDVAYKCGTLGCAIGECPVLFPEEWVFNDLGTPVLIGSRDPIYSAMSFFGLGAFQVSHLFIPEAQFTEELGGKLLTDLATKEEVASNIREFVKKYEEN